MESRSRTLSKTLSWRCIATLITFGVGWAYTGRLDFGLAIGLTDTTIKFVAYYFHERAWTRIATGYRMAGVEGEHGEGI